MRSRVRKTGNAVRVSIHEPTTAAGFWCSEAWIFTAVILISEKEGKSRDGM